MRRVTRTTLPKKVQTYLHQRQEAALLALAQGVLNVEREWKSARQTKAIEAVLNVLQQNVSQYEATFGEIKLEANAGGGGGGIVQ